MLVLPGRLSTWSLLEDGGQKTQISWTYPDPIDLSPQAPGEEEELIYTAWRMSVCVCVCGREGCPPWPVDFLVQCWLQNEGWIQMLDWDSERPSSHRWSVTLASSSSPSLLKVETGSPHHVAFLQCTQSHRSVPSKNCPSVLLC